MHQSLRYFDAPSAAEAIPALKERNAFGFADLQRGFRGAWRLLVWFTMDAGKVVVFGKPVELRLVPLMIIGGLALRTVLAWQAEKIRRGEG